MAEDGVMEEDMGPSYMEPSGPKKRACASSEGDGRLQRVVARAMVWSHPFDVFKGHSGCSTCQ